MLNPLVSVIIPVYNVELYLKQAITSVLEQTYKRLEIIVIDDGSSDGSARVAQSFGSKVRYYYQQNSGLSAARNKGVELSQGDFISFLDSDDMWTPDKIAIQLGAFQSDCTLDMVLGYVRQFYSPDMSDERRARLRYAEETMPGHLAGTLLITRNAFHRVGKFSQQLRIGEFVDWYARANDLGLKSLMLPDVVLHRRIHGENMGVRDRDKRADYLHVLKAALKRRRQVGV